MCLESPCAVAPRVGLAPWLLLAVVISGCAESSPMGRAGIEVVPPDGWTAASPKTFMVPGTPVAAWTGPDGSSFAVLTGLPIPSPDARGLATELATRFANLPGVSVVSAGEETVAGLKAARVVVVGQGTGDSLVPSGTGTPIAPPGKALIATRRVILTIPRRADTLTLLWHYPDSAREAIGPQVEQTIRSLKISDAAASTSSY